MADLAYLTPDECWRHLGKRVVGRIGFDLGHGPRIHPVNYRVDGTTVVLRTAEDSELARFIELFSAGGLVACEVDEVDYEWHQGWSVMIEGQIARVDAPEERKRLHAVWPRPWADGRRGLLARVTPVEVTGRRPPGGMDGTTHRGPPAHAARCPRGVVLRHRADDRHPSVDERSSGPQTT